MLGVPLYGYDFALGQPINPATGRPIPGYLTVPYKQIAAQYAGSHLSPIGNFKSPGHTPHPSFVPSPGPGDYPFAHNIYYETRQTAVDKLQFIRETGAQGLILWDLVEDSWDDARSIVKELDQFSGTRHEPAGGAITPKDIVVYLPKDGGPSVEVKIYDIPMTIEGRTYPGRTLVISSYGATARYYFDSHAAYLLTMTFGDRTGRMRRLVSVILNLIAREAQSMGVSKVSVLKFRGR
jgi:hypothetical protein